LNHSILSESSDALLALGDYPLNIVQLDKIVINIMVHVKEHMVKPADYESQALETK
jgi:hypothetical protein